MAERHREGGEADSEIRVIGMKMKKAMRWDTSEYLEAEADNVRI